MCKYSKQIVIEELQIYVLITRCKQVTEQMYIKIVWQGFITELDIILVGQENAHTYSKIIVENLCFIYFMDL